MSKKLLKEDVFDFAQGPRRESGEIVASKSRVLMEKERSSENFVNKRARQ
jgi:hypothetical protein